MARTLKNSLPARVRLAAYFVVANDEPSFHVPIIIFFGRDYLGLSFTTTILLFYGIGGLSTLFEVPAGAFADKYGRRLSYLIGSSSMAIGLGMWLIHGPIIIYIVGRIIFCIGSALSSGTVDSMMYEEYHRNGLSERYIKYKSRSRSGYYGLRLLAMPLGAYLFVIAPQWPIIISVISIISAGLISLLIPDNNVAPEEHTTMSLMKETIRKVLTNKPVRMLLIASFVTSSLLECYWRLFQPSYNEAGLNVANIGWFYAAFSVVAVVASLSVSKISNSRAVFVSVIVGFAIMVSYFSAIAIFPIISLIVIGQLLGAYLFSVVEIPVPAYAQHQFQKYQQTTMLSIYSAMFWGGLALGDILVAVLLAAVSINAIYIILAVMSLVASLIIIPNLYKYSKLIPSTEVEISVTTPPIRVSEPDPFG